ncbi:hypothetical protein Rwratislav_20946 [Rhodococcus wratislaviensis IFP 2016]|nr:hypothetical protein Rwratislav_20946 [Rhodococcus wratislaviensis IFP 2016]
MYTPSNNATATQTTPTVAATTTYPDSVVTSNAMVINGGGTGSFTVNARLHQTNSATVTAHLRKNGGAEPAVCDDVAQGVVCLGRT